MNTRRDFLQAAVIAGFPTIVPSRVFGAGAPSNLVQVAQIGCGRIARASDMAGIFAATAPSRAMSPSLRSGHGPHRRRQTNHRIRVRHKIRQRPLRRPQDLSRLS